MCKFLIKAILLCTILFIAISTSAKSKFTFYDNFFDKLDGLSIIKNEWRACTDKDGQKIDVGYDTFNFSLSNSPSITLFPPVGGETWIVGTKQNIKWTCIDVTNIMIEFSEDNGITWNTIISNTPAYTGNFSWTIPNVLSGSCLIRVRNVENIVNYSYNKATFTITNKLILKIWEQNIPDNVVTTAFSPDGALVAFGSQHGIIKIFNTKDGTFIWGKNELTTVSSIKFSPGGEKLFVARGGFGASMYNVSNGTLLWSDNFVSVGKVSFNHNGSIAATACSDRVKVYNANNGDFLWSGAHSSVVSNLMFSPDGKKIASVSWDKTIKMWDTNSGSLLWSGDHSSIVYSLCFRPDSKTIVSSAKDVIIWDVETGSKQTTIDVGGYQILSLDYSNDNEKIAIAGGGNVSGGCKVLIWDGSLKNIGKHYHAINSVKFSPDSKNIISASADSTIRFWDVNSSSLIWLGKHSGIVNVVDISHDGQKIASCSDSGNMVLWDIMNGSIVITNPSDNELWETGSTQNITWIGNNVDNVRIEYSTDNGNTWNTIIDNTPASSGNYEWVVPSTPSKNCRIRISDVSDSNIKDVSNSVFSINSSHNYSLYFDGNSYVEFPNSLINNNSFTIEAWIKSHYNGPLGSVVIFYHGSASEFNLVFGQDQKPGFGINSGSWSYLSSNTFIDTTKWNHIAGVFNRSENKMSFYLNGILQGEMTTPNQALNTIGDSYKTRIGCYGGSFFQKYEGFIDEVRLSDNLRYQTNFSPTTDFMSDSNTIGLWKFNEGSGNVIYDSGPKGNHGIMLNNPLFSNNIPTLQSINLLLPNGGENWEAGSTHNITWTSNDVINVKLEYTIDNGSSWIKIVDSTPAQTGSYSWTVPSILSTFCKIRISNSDDAMQRDESDDSFVITSSISNACVGTPTVTYAGKIYNTVLIGSQCWLRENLDIGTMIQGSLEQKNNGIIEKYCYNNDLNNCATYGGFYQWNEAMAFSTTPGSKGICPDGWHIPTLQEYETLRAAVNNNSNKLKEIGQGTGGGVGTNESGFSALLSGYHNNNGIFGALNYGTTFWSSSSNDSYHALYMYLDYSNITINFYNIYKVNGYSVRCLKDESTNTVPNIPTLLLPSNGSTIQSTSPTLNWNASSSASSYTLQVSANNSFSSYVYNQSGLPNTSRQVSGLSNLTTYYWRVRAANSLGTSDWSNVWSFTTTGIAPLIPSLSLPGNGATNQSIVPTLSWNSSSGADSYTLQVSINSDFTSYIYNQSGLTNTSQQISGLSNLKTYYWRVSATNNFGTSSFSNIWSFTTIGTEPKAPTPSSPDNGVVIQTLAPILIWSESSGADSYTLQVSTNNDFTNYIYFQSGLTNTSQQISGLSGSTTYYWKVSATNIYGTSSFSNVFSFTTLDYPSTISLATTRTFPGIADANSYRILGIPGNTDFNLSTVVTGSYNTDWKAFWDNGASDNYHDEYDGTATFNFQPGRAFWIISQNPININKTVSSVSLSSDMTYSIPLHSGWNLIANPFDQNILWNDVISINSITQPIWSFEGNYEPSSSFEPYKGYYFFNVTNLSSLKIPYKVIALAKTAEQEINGISLSLISNNTRVDGIEINFDDRAKDGPDIYDVYSPGNDFVKTSINILSDLSFLRNNFLKTDVRTSESDGHIYVLEITNKTRQNLIVRLEESTINSEVYLVDNSLVKVYDFKTEIIIPGTIEKKTFTMIIGPKEFLNTNVKQYIPTEVTLYQNYPNPFNPSTIIRFSLPNDGFITLQIFNVLGEKVKDIIDNRYYSSGFYEVSADLSLMPAGFYFYRIISNSDILTKKMLLIK